MGSQCFLHENQLLSMIYTGQAKTKSVSLPEDLLKVSEETAKEQNQRWSEYVKRLLVRDQEKRLKEEREAQQQEVTA